MASTQENESMLLWSMKQKSNSLIVNFKKHQTKRKKKKKKKNFICAIMRGS